MPPRARTQTSEELETAERQLEHAVVASDVDALAALLHNDVIYTGPDSWQVIAAHASALA